MVDLSKPPADPTATKGYDDLYRLWKSMSQQHEEGREIKSAEFFEYVQKIGAHLTPREARFFNEPFEPHVLKVADLIHAKTIARLYKILMDRQGFKVSKEGGGLG